MHVNNFYTAYFTQYYTHIHKYINKYTYLNTICISNDTVIVKVIVTITLKHCIFFYKASLFVDYCIGFSISNLLAYQVG